MAQTPALAQSPSMKSLPALLNAWPPAAPPVPKGVWDCLGEELEALAFTRLPENYATMIDACRRRAVEDLEPAGEDAIDQAIVLLSGLQLSPRQGVTAAALDMAYQIGLDDVPVDLLALGVRRAIQSQPFRPMPSEVRKHIEPELDARKRRLARLGAP